MKVFIAFLVVLAVAHGFAPGIRVKFDMGTDFGNTFFYSVPTTIDDARVAGWRQYRKPEGTMPQLQLYCPKEKTLCAFYDDTRHIAGLQVALRDDEFTLNPFDWKKRGFTKWRTAIDNTCYSLWTIQQYFVTEETYQRSLQERLASRDKNRILQEGAVWLKGINGELLKISTSEEDIKQSIFTVQACLPWMGQHYYYNMSAATVCNDEGILAWFPMTTGGELLATGFMTFGQLPIKAGDRDWFERPDTEVIKAIVPSGPDCLYNLAETLGALTMHIYYVDDPWNITC